MGKNILLLFCIIIWYVKTSAQVPNYVPTNGLVAWYSFNNNVNDLSGNENTPLNNNVNFVDDRFGNPNAAIDFNGFNSMMVLNNPNFVFSEFGEFTFSVWLNKQSQTTDGVVFMNGIEAPGYFVTAIFGQNETQFGVKKQATPWVTTTCSQTINRWDHYVAVYNMGLLSLYKNGIICTTAMYTNTRALSANMPLYFGRGLPGSINYYNGSMDDIGIWTRALTPEEISGLYVTGIGVEELSNKAGLMVSPNPARDFITVKINDSALGSSYEILDNTNKVVLSGDFSKSTTRIDISNLPEGTYLLKADKGGEKSFSILNK